MPSSEIIDGRPLKGGAVALSGGSPHPSEPENLPCPRCECTNTKFCYYNNYNLSQPRYFCKGCRRYWTRGGSLRNIPVGGGSRKNSKRSRANSAAHSPVPLQQISSHPLSSPASDVVNTTSSQSSAPETTPVSFLEGAKHETLSPLRCDMNLNEALPGSFSSLLCTQQGGGFLGGYGMGSGSSFDLLGFGFGKTEWPAMVDIGVGVDNDGHSRVGVGGGSSGGSSSGCNTWQMEGIDGGGLTDGGDCFGWPELAISTPGSAGGSIIEDGDDDSGSR